MRILCAALLGLVSFATAAAPQSVRPQDEAAQLAEVRRILFLVRDNAREMPPPDRDTLLAEIAPWLALSGDHVAAQEIANALPERDRDRVLAELARIKAFRDDVAGALQTAGAIRQSDARAAAFGGVAEARFARGDPSTAFRVVGDLPADSRSKVEALCTIAFLQHEKGDAAAARQTLAQAYELATGDRAALETPMGAAQAGTNLTVIARWQRRAGDLAGEAKSLERAKQLLARQGDSDAQTNFRSSLAAAFAHIGDYQSALEVAASAPAGSQRDTMLEFIAKQQVQAGQLPAALKTIESIGAPGLRNLAVQGIVVELAESGDTPGALQLAATMPEIWRRAQAMTEAAWFWAATDVPASKLFLREADAAVAELLKADHEAPEFLFTLRILDEIVPMKAWTQANNGDIPGALQTARGIRNDSSSANVQRHADALRHIAEAQVRAGDLRGALAWATEEKPGRVRALALAGIAEALLDKMEEERERRSRKPQ